MLPQELNRATTADASGSVAQAQITATLRGKNLPALDGLRAMSIGLVLVSHAGLQNFVPGGLGVVTFFVISGFLISRLMIEEIDASGELNIKKFYIRRVLRLFPALALFLLIFVPIIQAAGVLITGTHVASALLYFTNYYYIYIGYAVFSPIPILWSLAVEEHFYIFFPFIMRRFRTRFKTLLFWLMATAFFVLLWRLYLNAACSGVDASADFCGLPDGSRIYKGTDSIGDCIIYGIIASLLLRLYPTQTQRLIMNPVTFYASGVVLLFTLLFRDPDFRETLRYSLQAISLAIIVVNVALGGMPFFTRIFSHPVLVEIGRWSYALYLFHFGIMMCMGAYTQNRDIFSGSMDIAIYFVASLSSAAAVYYLVERPMQALRHKFGSRAEG
ncbi:MAG: acyltransferase [Alphaproteobacteria bacterium]